MSVAETVMEKLSALPPQQQEQVLRYVESLPPASAPSVAPADEPHPWIKVALSMNLDGPPDWSEKFEDYLNRDLGEPRS